MSTRNWVFISLTIVLNLTARSAWALPAFAIREKVSCTLCHTNGSAPHLTFMGYLYRRAGFRFPQNIGNKLLDEKNMDILKHFVAGMNVDYTVGTLKPQGPTADATNNHAEALVNNNIDVREAEIWPLVGAFFGNFATWVELDMTPGTAPGAAPGTPPGIAAASTADIGVSQADLRYVNGNADFFYGVRAGMIAPEGYGASDQWIDDGGIPLMDTLPAVHSATGLNTLATPLGAMNIPQMGAEFQANWPRTFLTIGAYNGFDGTSGGGAGTAGTLTPAQMNAQSKASKDVKVQVDKVFDRFAVTAVYYNGRIALLDPTNTVPFEENYQEGRLYGTYFMLPNKLDLMAGVGAGQYGFVDPGGSTISGYFDNMGGFVGGNWYVKEHLTLSGRLDYYQYDTSASPRPVSQDAALMASMPYENNIFVFHLIRTEDTLNGVSNEFRFEWRFLF